MNSEILSAWSTPWGAEISPPFPFSFRDVTILTVAYRTDEAAASWFLPPPLRLRSNWVLVHLYRMGDVDFNGPYGECNVMLDAELPGKASGGYSPFLFLNTDAGLAQGREVHGQPKRYGNVAVEYRGDLVVGSLERNGIEVITATMAYKQRRGNLEDLKAATFDFALNLNYKVLQHIDGTPAVRQITSRRLADVKVFECWTGPGSIEIRKNVQAPIYRLPVVAEGFAVLWKAEFTLVPGQILHDYLADPAA